MILLVAIDAKFIHTNMAVRYLKANCDFPCVIKEFTINDRFEHILNEIIDLKPQLIGFSVYIWNATIIRRLTEAIKAKTNAIVLWGGPEVSHDPENHLTECAVDYIIAGEGEIAFNLFAHALAESTSLEAVPNLVYRKNGSIIANPMIIPNNMAAIKDPYHFAEFFKDIPNKIQYVELSRGCPYHCTYCLASLENNVRYFPIDRVKQTIAFLLERGARVFKYLDRTFNLREPLAREMFDYLININDDDVSFQFEITGDILSESLIDHINETAPKNRFRFEIGVQSTNPKTNLLVKRNQNTDKLFRAIRMLKAKNVVDLHLDLIAGLPEEDLDSFEHTFNETYLCFAKELQLGFLKLLRGTPIRNQHERHGYRFSKEPPYEVIENNYMTKQDLAKIRLVEKILNIHWNKAFMNETIRWLTENVASPFKFFLALAEFYEQNGYGYSRYQLADVFERLNKFLQSEYPEISAEAFSLMKLDYLTYHRQKPKLWWEKVAHKNEILRAYYAKDQRYSLETLYKHAVVTTFQDHFLLALYLKDKPIIIHHWS